MLHSTCVGTSQKLHNMGETSNRYLGYRLEMGQKTKKVRPAMKYTSFMQNFIGAVRHMRKREKKQNSVARVLAAERQ